MAEPTLHELWERITRLEERMNTLKAEYTAGFERIESRLTEDAAKREAEAAKRETEYRTAIGRLAEDAAKRENRMLMTVAGLIVAGITILGVTVT